MQTHILRAILAASLLVMCADIASAQYTAFNTPGIEGTQSGYDFDDSGPFSGVWHGRGVVTNGLQLTINPQLQVFSGVTGPVPWNTAQISMAVEGFDWDSRWWVTNFTGEVSGLSSGQIVTIFFLYRTGSEQMRVKLDDQVIGTLLFTEETNSPRLHKYGWITNGVPAEARVLGASLRMNDDILEFDLTQLPNLTNTPTIDVYGILIDTNNASSIDNDGDSQQDWQEVITGMNAFDSNSLFRITEFTQSQDGSLIISWPSASNRTYTVESRTNLLQGGDGQLITNVVAEPPLNSVTTAVHVLEREFISIQVTD